MPAVSPHPQEHPAPQRGRVGVVVLLAALASGPSAWVIQLLAGYGVASLACFPHDAPAMRAPPPGWSGEPALLLALNLACLVLCLGGTVVAFRHWRRTQGEKPGDAHVAMDVGEGRTRFLAACGVMTGLIFAAAILFDTAPILGTPSCWSLSP